MSREHEMQNDIDNLRQMLKEEYDSIVLPQNLDTENMLKMIDDMPQDNVLRPSFRRNAMAAGIAAVFIAAVSFLTLPSLNLTGTKAPEASPAAQEFAMGGAGDSDFADRGIAEEGEISIQSEFKAGDAPREEISQNSEAPPTCALQKEVDIPESGEFSLMQIFPREGITTIEVGSPLSSATAVYTTPEEIGAVIEIIENIKLEKGAKDKSDLRGAEDSASLRAVVVYDDGSFFEIALDGTEVVINLKKENLVIVSPKGSAAAGLLDKYKKDIGI